MVKTHKNNPDINEAILVKGCPSKIENIKEALETAGINANQAIFDNAHLHAGFFMKYYKDAEVFDPDFFTIKG